MNYQQKEDLKFSLTACKKMINLLCIKLDAMKSTTILLFLIIVTATSCGSKPGSEAVDSKNNDSVGVQQTDTIKDTEDDAISTDEETDCVFDTSTYKFTTEAIKKYDPYVKIHWDNDKKETMTILNGDTLWLRIGGCYHFGYSARLSTRISFDDTLALINKAHWLAKNFFDGGFDTKYDRCISQGLFKSTETYDPAIMKAYELTDGDTAITNMIFEGFSFERHQHCTLVAISGYVD